LAKAEEGRRAWWNCSNDTNDTVVRIVLIYFVVLVHF
jgi:hypothetical protein